MIIFAAGVASALLLLAGIALLIYLLLRKAHLQHESAGRSRVIADVKSLPRQRPTWQTNENGVEAAEIVRDLNGQLTSKMIVLEQLIAQSQKQIDRLEELLKRVETTTGED